MTRHVFRTQLLLVAGTLVVFALGAMVAEMSYRLRLRRPVEERELTYRVAPAMYVEFDEAHGERFKPGSDLWVTYVRDGRVVWGTVASRSNRDGLGGRTTLAEYDSSEVKVLVFGDSFTHWNQEGVSWPDLLQDELERRLDRRVAVLNYARGAYGVIQMLELAAERATALKPDLIVVAPIGDDFSRARWWCREVERDGHARWMLSSKKDSFLDCRFAVDEVLLDSRATRSWCDSTLRLGGLDPVVESLNRRYSEMAREMDAVRKRVRLFSVRESYLLRRLVLHDPFGSRLRALPRTTISNYRDDPGASTAIETLRAARIPVMLVYLPTRSEVVARKSFMSPQARRLARSLEREFGSRFEELHSGFVGQVPDPFDLKPFDGHPSRPALQFYAEQVAERCLGAYLKAGREDAVSPIETDPH
jgi:hypothetical protein